MSRTVETKSGKIEIANFYPSPNATQSPIELKKLHMLRNATMKSKKNAKPKKVKE